MNDRGGRAIIAIDLLRFACALLVVAYHFGTGMMRSPSPHAKALLAGLPLPEGAVGATWFGWVGVELFFVVSGVVIARSALGLVPGTLRGDACCGWRRRRGCAPARPR
jgi:peptidoglycan/LPS O-acetylase OafA/YrhL